MEWLTGKWELITWGNLKASAIGNDSKRFSKKSFGKLLALRSELRSRKESKLISRRRNLKSDFFDCFKFNLFSLQFYLTQCFCNFSIFFIPPMTSHVSMTTERARQGERSRGEKKLKSVENWYIKIENVFISLLFDWIFFAFNWIIFVQKIAILINYHIQ